MSGILNKVFDKIVIIIVAVLFIVGFRELVLTDNVVEEAFAELIGLLPFAENIVEPIMTLFKCKYEVYVISSGTVAEKVLCLIIMALIQPWIMAAITRMVIPIPAGLTRSYEMEQYVSSFGYRAKELAISILLCPAMAAFSAWLAKRFVAFLWIQLGTAGGILTGIGVVIAGIGVSVIPLVTVGGMTLGLALLWRLLVTLLPKILEVTVTNTLCIAVYVAVVGGVQRQIFITIGALVVWFIIWGSGMRLIMRGIAGTNLFGRRKR